MGFLALLLLWPAAELFVAIEIANAIGVLATVLLLIVSWPVGGWAMRSQGRTVWRRFGDAVASGKPPGRQAIDGALVLIGGLLMIIPGFITDALGALLLLPPTRAAARGLFARNLRSRLVVRATGFGRGPTRYDAEATAIDLERPQLRP
ncbi:MAG: FxsA family protein [Actinomycetota bacterium]|nr:FxsA family protein [Actinomycetota bacterium]